MSYEYVTQQQPNPYPQEDRVEPGYAPAPAYAAPNAGYAYPPVAPSTNGLAIASLVCALLGSAILPVVLGHLALAQIRRTGEGGTGLAVAGLVIGYLEIVVILVVVLFVVALATSS